MCEKGDLLTLGHRKSRRRLGILVLDRKYRLVAGNTAREDSYNYPVVLWKVEGLFNPPRPPVYDRSGELTKEARIFISAAQELEKVEVSAIVSSCGFFSLIQTEVSKALRIPVYTSPLLLIPFVQTILPPIANVGLLTLFKEYLSEDYFSMIPRIDMNRLVISDMRNAREFRRMIIQDIDNIDERDLEKEVLTAAGELVKSGPDIGAIVVECSDMTPYSEKIRRKTGLPVFDYRTLADIAYQASFILQIG